MKTFAFTTPLKFGDGTLSEIKMREPCAGDLRGIKMLELHDGDVTSAITLASRICTPFVSVPQLSAMTPYDALQLYASVVDFFAPPETPATSPEGEAMAS